MDRLTRRSRRATIPTGGSRTCTKSACSGGNGRTIGIKKRGLATPFIRPPPYYSARRSLRSNGAPRQRRAQELIIVCKPLASGNERDGEERQRENHEPDERPFGDRQPEKRPGLER